LFGEYVRERFLEAGHGARTLTSLGLPSCRTSQVLSKSSTPTRGLFALGPLCQESLWEITAVPEIVRQCDQAAESIAVLDRATTRKMELYA